MENVFADFEQLITWTEFNDEKDFENYFDRLCSFPKKVLT